MGFSLRSWSGREQNDGGKERTALYLNVYDLTPVNNYLYWLGLGIFHSGIEVHGMEYGYGAHEYATSGVFEVEPRSCPGFIFRKAIPLGTTDMTRAEFRTFMQHLATKYHGDTYHLIAKNCNHFTDEVCLQLTGKSIPGWVNRLARLAAGSYFNCLLPENIQIAAVRQCPDHIACSEDGSESPISSASVASEEEVDDPDLHHLLTTPTADVAFLQEKPVRMTREMV
ncbi:deSI-like protein At4g17486 isoform X1 [Beta vulgaris subsp. vulgaris]|uniref:deSI-like protein At4g17486 isoform X1 n=1 Tax=Beta vulgaris subsp. vulgaris TaxID=3555 RepID=UPI002036F1A7|nr:deSI-like protein At4g17486 isoform X1 [Beta vulgaris subsp. vulgaris]